MIGVDVDFAKMGEMIDRPERRVTGEAALAFGDEQRRAVFQMAGAVRAHIGLGRGQGDEIVHADFRKAPGGRDLDGYAATQIAEPPGADQNV